jgi:adenine-specific DNA methylase
LRARGPIRLGPAAKEGEIMWLFYVVLALGVCGLAVFGFLSMEKRKDLKARARRFGVCPECNIPYDSRQKVEKLKKQVEGGETEESDLWITEVFCPQCGTVKDTDREDAIRRAEKDAAEAAKARERRKKAK